MKNLVLIIATFIFCLSLTIIPGSRAENNRKEKEKISKEESKMFDSTKVFSPSPRLSVSLSFLLSGTKTVGPTGDYTSIGAALTDIQTQGLDGALILELQPNYVSTVETFPLNFMNLTGISAVNTVTLRPQTGAANLNIAGNNSTAIVNLDNAQFVTIDGRPGGTGTVKELTIENTSTSGATIRFINDAGNNTIRNTVIRGATTSQTNGVVFFSTTTGANGNDNNTITNNDIGDSTTTPRNAVLSLGTIGTAEQNNNNTISNNNIFNFYLASGDATGVQIFSGNDGWTISGNSFFHTAARSSATGTTRGIQIFSGATGGNFTVSNNFIGGSQTNAGGTPWTNSGTTVDSRFVGIQLNVSSQDTSSVQGNTVRNIAWETSGATAALPGIFTGIFVQQGSVNIGTTAGNTIGSGTGTGSISVTTSGSGGRVFGIGAASFPDRNISGNTIGSITTNGTNANVSASFVGIEVTNGINMISNNLIGSLTTANSINAINSSTATIGQQVIGIHSTNTNFSGVTVNNNTIANLNNNYVGNALIGQVIGIATFAGSNTITGNTVRHLSTTSLNTGIKADACVIGILQNSTSSTQTISQNTIQSLNYTGTNPPLANNLGAGELRLTGIYMRGACLGNPHQRIVKENVVESFRPSAGAFFAVLFGFDSDGEAAYQNNMVSLGVDENEDSITEPVKIVGINETGCGSKFDNNSVNIAGEDVQAGTNDTSAFRSELLNYLQSSGRIRGNILVNTRTNTDTGGEHYVFDLALTEPEPSGLDEKFNIYFQSFVGLRKFGKYGGNDITTVQEWRSVTGLGATSAFVDPKFVSNTDLHLQTTNPATQILLDTFNVDFDFDGEARPNPPQRTAVGADENQNFISSGDFFASEIHFTPLSNGSTATPRTLTNFAFIIDNIGVQNVRLYYKKSTDADVFLSCNCSSENGWKFVAPTNSSSPYSFSVDYTKLFSSVVIGDEIEYFLVADDAANNLSSAPAGAGASGNPPALNINLRPSNVRTYRIVPTISGTATVGQGGDFTSLTNDNGLLDLLEAGFVTASDLTVRIISDLPNETGTHAAKKLATDDPNSVFRLIIEPNDPTEKLISGDGANGGLLRVDGGFKLEIDGRFNDAGSFFRFRNTNNSNPTVRIVNGSRDITFRNLTIEGGNTAASGVVNVTASGTSSNDFIQFFDLTIRDRSDVVTLPSKLFVSTGSLTVPNKNVEIKNSNIVNFQTRGIEATSGNELFFITDNLVCPSGSANTTEFGGSAIICTQITNLQLQAMVLVAFNGKNSFMQRNRFEAIGTLRTVTGVEMIGQSNGTNVVDSNRFLITTTPSSTGTQTGIQSFGGGNLDVKNNQITIILNGSNQRVVGILNEGFLCGGYTAYYNTTLINGTATGSNQTSAAERGSSACSNDDWKNNIWFNNLSGNNAANYAIRRFGNTGTFDSDHNLFIGTGNPNSQEIFEDGFQSGDLSTWATSTGGDVNSIAGVAGSPFVDSNGFALQNFTTSMFVDPANGNLNINTGTGYDAPPIISNRGTPIAGITTDFGGTDTRHPTHPDIGSDEGDVNRNLITSGTLPPGNYDNIFVGTSGGLTELGGTGITATLGGIINVGGTLSVNCNSTLAGASPTAFVNGNVKKDFCSPGIFDYPVGTIANGNEYSPVSVNVTNLPTNPSSLTVKANYGFAPANPPLNSPTTLRRFWTINETGDLTADLLFNYLQTDVNGDESMYRIFRVPNGGSAQFFNNHPACDPDGPVTNISPCVYWDGPNQMFIGGITDFSDWAAGIPLTPTAAGALIQGRVVTSGNGGINNAVITLTGGNLTAPRKVKTNPFGYFRFNDVEVGQVYILSVEHRQYGFGNNTRILTLFEDVDDILFEADWEN